MATQTRYITTAIVYPNSRIHVGWAWECLGADWMARVSRAFGDDVFFVSGMDEHSLNVERKAVAQGLSPKQYCDQMATDIKGVLEGVGITYDRFIRTSDEDHHRVVTELIQRSFKKGDIYRAKYDGHYCESCEAFYTEKDLVDGLCPQHKKPTAWITEENYFFKLTKYEAALKELFKSNPEFLEPENRRNEILAVLDGGLRDFSISRSNFSWGIPLPFGKGEVIYVWFDALINYLTAAGFGAPGADGKKFDERWRNVLHIIGKDITRFHCIYWPAMLMSMELPVPKRVFAHGFIQLKGEKMSKSLGTMVTPDEVIAVTGADPFRYFMLAENPFSKDGNFSWEALVEKTNADLSNSLGNLFNRTLNMALKYFPENEWQMPKVTAVSEEIKRSFEQLLPALAETVDRVSPSDYIAFCQERVRLMNLFIDREKPWTLAKTMETSPETKARLYEGLFALLEGSRWLATVLEPVLPFKIVSAFSQLGVPALTGAGAFKKLHWGEARFQPQKPEPIYPRIELPKV